VERSISIAAPASGSLKPDPLVVYILLSHKDPVQVESLAERILDLSPRGLVLVHHDLNSERVPWCGCPPARVRLTERSRLSWGAWSIVEATLRLMSQAEEDLQADWIVIISGEHWPCTDLATWERGLGELETDAIVSSIELPRRLHFGARDLEPNVFLSRVVQRWSYFAQPRWRVGQVALRQLSRIALLIEPIFSLEFSIRHNGWFIGVPRRRGPVRGWEFVKGSQWLACTSGAVRSLKDVDPLITTWFKKSYIADESYLQSVFHNDPRIRVSKDRVCWLPPQPYPWRDGWMTLSVDDVDNILTSGAPFARKVDFRINPAVVSALNAAIDAERSPRTSPDVGVTRETVL
jgi:hypothetical protein